MNDFIIKIIPVILIFFLGILLKKIKVLKNSDSDLLLKLVFYVCLPSLTIISTQKVELVWQHLYIPAIPIVIVLFTFVLSSFFTSRLKISRQTKGTFIVGAMIMNTAFVFPFVLSAFGEEGFAFATIFQFGTGLSIFTFIYYIAMRHSPQAKKGIDLKKFLLLPPIWALTCGIILNLSGAEMPVIMENFFGLLGSPTIPLVMLSLGVYFKPEAKNIGRLSLVFIIRIVGGFLISMLLTSLLNITGMVRTVIVLCASAPVGYNTLVFSTMENLDKEFAASLVSISLILGMVYIPILVYLLG
ncbi:AEC family transporter [Candidatus Cloacimonadota bacterium]